MLGDIILILCHTGQADPGFPIAPLDKSAAIKAGVWVAAAEYIRPSLILQGFIYHLLRQLPGNGIDRQVLVYQL
jgi:hypothetical protein